MRRFLYGCMEGDTLRCAKLAAVVQYARGLLRVAIVLSVLVAVAWALLIVTTPSDPQIGVEYIFTTLYAILALIVIWAIFGFTAVRRRRRHSVKRPAARGFL